MQKVMQVKRFKFVLFCIVTVDVALSINVLKGAFDSYAPFVEI